mmetsp:Transcript_22877/g.58085  ORF Transcript_22877/g.58085 Transcript_22877/m.58085 type:complete len:311 (-) Transcript_22877:170-1102(-)
MSKSDTETSTVGCAGRGCLPSFVTQGCSRSWFSVMRVLKSRVSRPRITSRSCSDALPAPTPQPLGCGKSTMGGHALIRSITSIGVAAMKGASANTHTYSVTPTAHMSHARASYLPASPISHISGEKKAGVPAVFLVASAPASVKKAVPKSAILSMRFLRERSRLSGLMSRCVMPFMCKYSKPNTKWRTCDQITASRSAMGTPSFVAGCEDPPSTNSSTINTSSAEGSSITSTKPTQFGWRIFFISAISALTLSSALPNLPCRCRRSADFLSTLTASCSPASTARKTSPNDPLPSGRKISYWLTCLSWLFS